MLVSSQELTEVKRTIQDCRINQAWPDLKPLFLKLYHACSAFNEARETIMQRMDPGESSVHELQSEDWAKQQKSVENFLDKLRKRGAHFNTLASLDRFCAAFVQAMDIEFGEDAEQRRAG